MPNNKIIIQETIKFVSATLQNNSNGHDIFHIERVVKNALSISKKEGGDAFIIELSAWLHDIGDYKINDGVEKHTLLVPNFLRYINVDEDVIKEVLVVISSISFKGGFNSNEISLEGKIVQDADRLDAIGAIGIARAFAFGGSENRLMYDPEQKITEYANFEAYKNSNAPTLNHFYEKLLKLKDLMHTSSAKEIAEQRHAFMENYLTQFIEEWNGLE